MLENRSLVLIGDLMLVSYFFFGPCDLVLDFPTWTMVLGVGLRPAVFIPGLGFEPPYPGPGPLYPELEPRCSGFAPGRDTELLAPGPRPLAPGL